MTAPTTAGGAVLPITDWRDGAEYWSAVDDDATKGAIALTLHAPAQAEIDALRAELAGAYELLHLTEDRLAALKAALNLPANTPPTGVFVQAAQDDQARDAGRLSLLETALSEVLEFQCAPEGPHIFDWGRWRRIRDNTPPFQRAAAKETP